MGQDCSPNALSVEGCRQRQERLRRKLAALKLDAALLSHPMHVCYFTGLWTSPYMHPTLLVRQDGPAIVATGVEPTEPIAADEVVVYTFAKLCTMVDDQAGESMRALLPSMAGLGHVGVDEPRCLWLLPDCELVDLNEALWAMRRCKDPDEVAVIRRAIVGAEAAYAKAKELVHPGVSELWMFTQLQAAAIEAVGESIGPFGNDFRSNAMGGLPRQRPMQAGELVIYDLGVNVRAHHCDNARTFAVNGKPTDQQLEAHGLIVAALEHVQSTVKPGVSCKQLYQQVLEMLDGKGGWSFWHHLGHGIGLRPHEGPRLNPNWDDTFQIGDVFTAEPGLYGEGLNAGIRLEQNYLVTETGIERLTSFPLNLSG